MSGVKIVSVVNNFETFNRCIKNNEFLSNIELITFDNTFENIGISERYNSFIDTIKKEDDFWVCFLHQDFIFNENPADKLDLLPRDSIYGAVGLQFPFYFQLKPKPIIKLFRRCTLGQIKEGAGYKIVGNRVIGNPSVKTIDCCCCIVHSTLIFENKLRFDENLKFHMYVEDFCYSAKEKNIQTKIVQFDCRHLSGGCQNEELGKSADYVKLKHNLKYISSTCYR